MSDVVKQELGAYFQKHGLSDTGVINDMQDGVDIMMKVAPIISDYLLGQADIDGLKADGAVFDSEELESLSIDALSEIKQYVNRAGNELRDSGERWGTTADVLSTFVHGAINEAIDNRQIQSNDIKTIIDSVAKYGMEGFEKAGVSSAAELDNDQKVAIVTILKGRLELGAVEEGAVRFSVREEVESIIENLESLIEVAPEVDPMSAPSLNANPSLTQTI